VGYRFRGRSYAYNVIVEPRGGSVHNTQFNLDALAAMGVPIVDRSLHLRWQAEDEAYVDEFLAKRFTSADRLVALNTGGGWYTKRWPLSSFAELGDRLATALGVRIVLPWGPGQLEDVHTVARSMRCAPFIPPETTLPQLAAFLHRCAAVVSNDSGPMHMAAAVGTPVLGIYGPTNPALQGPYGPGHRIVRKEGLSCLACNLTACPIGHPCMQTLTVDEVFSAFLPLWQSLPSPAPR
jgi:ADP-heptose:LPS heptosyltransferase